MSIHVHRCRYKVGSIEQGDGETDGQTDRRVKQTVLRIDTETVRKIERSLYSSVGYLKTLPPKR